MKYTIKTFFKSLISDKKELKYIESSWGELYFKWDGEIGEFYSYHDNEVQLFDKIYLTRDRRNSSKFKMDIISENYWFITLEFSENKIVKNKEYKLSDYIK